MKGVEHESAGGRLTQDSRGARNEARESRTVMQGQSCSLTDDGGCRDLLGGCSPSNAVTWGVGIAVLPAGVPIASPRNNTTRGRHMSMISRA